MASAPREMALIGFLQAQNCSNYVGSWRHPATMGDFLTPEYYQRIARTLEHGKFHLNFFDDRLAMPDILGNDHREAVRNGVRVVKMDPSPLMMAMGLATEHLGIGDDAPSRAVRFTDIERKAIEGALADNNGNRTRAARQLGISLRTLQYRLKEYGLV